MVLVKILYFLLRLMNVDMVSVVEKGQGSSSELSNKSRVATRHRSRPLRNIAFFFLYLISVSYVFGQFLTAPAMNSYYRALVPDLIEGKAYRPFQYRVLLPFSLNAISKVVPAAVQTKLTDTAWPLLKPWLPQLKWNRDQGFYFLISSAAIYVIFVAWAYIIRELVKVFYRVPPWCADVAPVAACLLLPLFFVNNNFLYDPMTILLSTLVPLLLVSRSKWYWPTFVLCCLNKETAILFSLLYLIYHLTIRVNTLNRTSLILGLAAHVGVWLPIKVAISWFYSSNPGQVVEWTWMYNIELFQTPKRLLWWGGFTLVCATLCLYNWKSKPLFLRWGFVALAVPLFAFATVFGIFDELRAFYEIYPLLFLLIYPTLLSLVEVYRLRFMSRTVSKIYCEPLKIS